MKLSKLFFVEVLGFCCMGNHFHLLVRMRPDTSFTDTELKKCLAAFNDKEPIFYEDGQLPYYREKLTNLSEYIRECAISRAETQGRREKPIEDGRPLHSDEGRYNHSFSSIIHLLSSFAV